MGKFRTAINHATLTNIPLEEFLPTVSAAGFEGVELQRDETFDYLDSHSVEDLKSKLDRARLTPVALNAINQFSLCDEAVFGGMCRASERFMKVGKKIGCNLIIITPSLLDQSRFPKSKTMDITVERLQALRALAQKYDFRIGLKPLGVGNSSVRTISQALTVLEGAEKDGLPRSGLVIDTFHYFLAEQRPADLQSIPIERLLLIHFSDCIKKPLKVLQDADRTWPGEGFFDLKGIIACLKEMNYDGFLSLELFNPAIWKMEPRAAAKLAIESLQKFTKL